MKKARLLCLLISVLMIGTLVGCGGDSGSTAPAADTASASDGGTTGVAEGSTLWNPEGGNKVGITVIDGIIPHCQAFIAGASAVIEAHGDIPVALDPSFDPVKQTENISDLVSQGCVGIVCETVDGQALISVVERAVEQGVLVVSADFPFAESRTDLIVSQVMTDNVKAGEDLAEQMAKDLDYKGQIITLAPPGQGPQDRVQGFKNVIDKYPDMELVYEGDGEGNIEPANALAQNLMQAYPDVSAYICSNDEQAIGAYTAYEAAGKADQVKFYGFDAAPEALVFIAEGKTSASLRQMPYQMGYMAAEDLYKGLKGEAVGDAVKYVDHAVVTIDNWEEFTGYYEGDGN